MYFNGLMECLSYLTTLNSEPKGCNRNGDEDFRKRVSKGRLNIIVHQSTIMVKSFNKKYQQWCK